MNYDNNIKTKTAILVTSYCGDPYSDIKYHMTRTLCKQLSTFDLFVTLSSHSVIPVDIQQYCNLFIFDSNNSFYINKDLNLGAGHSLPELTCIINMIGLLKNLGFPHFLKMSFDTNPTLDFLKMVKDCENFSEINDKKVISGNWGCANDSIATHLFFSEIDFFEKTLSLNEAHRLIDHSLEWAWYNSINEKGLLDKVYQRRYYDQGFMGQVLDPMHFSENGGTNIVDYPF